MSYLANIFLLSLYVNAALQMRAFQLVKKQVLVPHQIETVFFVTRRNGRVCPGAVQGARFQGVLADEGEARGGGG